MSSFGPKQSHMGFKIRNPTYASCTCSSKPVLILCMRNVKKKYVCLRTSIYPSYVILMPFQSIHKGNHLTEEGVEG